MKTEEMLLPGETMIDRMRMGTDELLLTDQRLLALAGTDALGPEYTLLQGQFLAGAPLGEVHSFIFGVGKRPLLLFISLAFAVAAGLMLYFPISRYPGLCAVSLCLITFIVWIFWPKSFVTINMGGLKISGQARRAEVVVFLERMQLAALAARQGKSPEQVRAAADLAGKPKDQS